MRSLFLKIFLWFWATVILTGIALVVTFFFEPQSVPSRWHATLTETARYTGTVAVERVETGQAPAASAYLLRLQNDMHLKACLFDSRRVRIAGDNCDIFQDMVSHVSTSRNYDFSVKFGITRIAMVLSGRSGQQYIFATELPAGPRAAFGLNRTAFLLQSSVAFLVSGFICYLLTRYLTAPILRLREASQRLAYGDLNTRAAPGMENRRDELGDLVCDFNAMADRIELLISQQRQLIYDVSHELRSPLARLNVALDIGRERKGDDPAFDQMAQDLDRLNRMIARLLAIAKLDTTAAPVEFGPVSLTALASLVVDDARFESQERGVAVKLTADGPYLVAGSLELLHGAIENVVRNAIHYTTPGTSVEVSVESNPSANPKRPSVWLTVRDYGPGVPDAELGKIFQPFYRAAQARDRQSGGTGLGLAIAKRVVQIHGGTIRARNTPPQGFQVQIQLPVT